MDGSDMFALDDEGMGDFQDSIDNSQQQNNQQGGGSGKNNMMMMMGGYGAGNNNHHGNNSSDLGAGVGGLLAASGVLMMVNNSNRRRQRQNATIGGTAGSTFDFPMEPAAVDVKKMFPGSDELAKPHVCSVIADVRLMGVNNPIVNQLQQQEREEKKRQQQQDDQDDDDENDDQQQQKNQDAAETSSPSKQQRGGGSKLAHDPSLLSTGFVVPKIIDLIKLAKSVRNVEVHPNRKTAVIRLRDPKCAAAVRMGGVITITGCTNVAAAKRAATIVCKIIRRAMGWSHDDFNAAIFVVTSTTVRFDLKHPLRIDELYKAHPKECSYEPESYSGCNIRLSGTLPYVNHLAVQTGENTNVVGSNNNNNNNSNNNNDNNDNDGSNQHAPGNDASNHSNHHHNNNNNNNNNMINKRWTVAASVYSSGKVVLLGACGAREAMAAYNGLLPKLKQFAGNAVYGNGEFSVENVTNRVSQQQNTQQQQQQNQNSNNNQQQQQQQQNVDDDEDDFGEEALSF